MAAAAKGDRRENDVGSAPVYLNVYDITSINGYAHWLGLGVYHSGVQVHGVEYAYGAHEHPTTGIFEGEPRRCEGFAFRKAIEIGRTKMSPEAVRAVMEVLAEDYRGDAYNLITKNCNHFCEEACARIAGNQIPRWINRLARIGFLCNYVLPVTLSAAKLQQRQTGGKACKEDKKKSSGRSTLSSSSSSSSSSSPSCAVFRRNRRRRSASLPPTTPLFTSSSSSSSSS